MPINLTLRHEESRIHVYASLETNFMKTRVVKSINQKRSSKNHSGKNNTSTIFVINKIKKSTIAKGLEPSTVRFEVERAAIAPRDQFIINKPMIEFIRQTRHERY